MAEGDQQPVIIKKVVKGGHAHHGGAWKIAYADFVTAMMAFFLLLWLLNSVTQESLEGISNYFAPVAPSASTSGSGDVLGGKTITEDGTLQNDTARDSVTVDLPPPKAGTGGDFNESEQAEKTEEEDIEAKVSALEQEQLDEAQEQLREVIEDNPAFNQFRNSLLVDNTPEGLRIQLIDRDGLAMFPSGSSKMYLHAQKILEAVSKVILSVPQNISVSGHTDATAFNRQNYGNWELSADRANAARRQLERFGVPDSRVNRIVGKGPKAPLLADDPSHPSNRRLSIILLRGTGDQSANLEAAKQLIEEELPGLNEIKRRQTLGIPDPSPESGGDPENSIITPLPPASPGTKPSSPAVPGLNFDIQADTQS